MLERINMKDDEKIENEFCDALDMSGDIVIKGPGIEGEVTFEPSTVLKVMDINRFNASLDNFRAELRRVTKEREDYNAGK